MVDAITFLAWISINYVLISACIRVCNHLPYSDSYIHLTINVIVLAWSLIVGVAILLGSAGVLNGATLLAGVAALSVVIHYRLRDASSNRPCAVRPSAARGHHLGGREWAIAWALFLTVWFGRFSVTALRTFPLDYDSLMYHIPLVDQWLQAKSLFAPDCSHWSQPGNSEILGLWIVAPFSGDFLIALNNLPAAILLAFSTVELSASLGLVRPLSHLCGVAVVCNHVVFIQLTNATNDIATASLFLCTLFYGLRYVRLSRSADLGLGAVCLGLLSGVKFYSLGYAAVAWAMIGLLALSVRGLRAALRLGLTWAVGALLWGGYWYARNVWATGRPLYPKGASPEGDLFSLIYPRMWESSLIGNGRPELLPHLIGAVWNLGGPCHVAAFVGVPGCILWLIGFGVWRGRRPGGTSGPRRWALGLMLAASGLVWVVTPFAVEDIPGTLNQLKAWYTPVRYGIGFLSLSLIAATLVLQDATRMMRHREVPGGCLRVSRSVAGHATARLLLGVWTAAVATQFAMFAAGDGNLQRFTHLDSKSVKLAGLVLLMLAIFAYTVYNLFSKAHIRLRAMLLGAIIAVVAATAAGWRSREWHGRFGSFYDSRMRTQAFGTLAGMNPSVSRICVLDDRSYAFFGSRRQFFVYNPYYIGSYTELVDEIRKRKIDVVVARFGWDSSWGRYRGVDRWLTDRPGAFHLFAKGPAFSAFLVDHGALDGGADHSTFQPLIAGSGDAGILVHLESRLECRRTTVSMELQARDVEFRAVARQIVSIRLIVAGIRVSLSHRSSSGSAVDLPSRFYYGCLARFPHARLVLQVNSSGSEDSIAGSSRPARISERMEAAVATCHIWHVII
jgi:hypothetical protein